MRPIAMGQAMTQIPSVVDGRLLGTAAGEVAGLAVGSPAWFAWLAGDDTKSFSFRAPAGNYTARKEHRQRGGAYWVAYRTAAGRQHKAYLGKGDELTAGRLWNPKLRLVREILLSREPEVAEFPRGWRWYHRLAAHSTAWSRTGTIVLHYRF